MLEILEEIDKLLDEFLDDSLFIEQKREFIKDVLFDYISSEKDKQYIVQSLGHLLGDHLSLLQIALFIEEAEKIKRRNAF